MPVQVDGKQIHRWAEVTSDEGVLRRLVARLLWASTRLRQLRMEPGSAKYLPGWDGLVESDHGSAHCPVGLSGWELSTREDVKRKLDEDYGTRKQAPNPLVPARSSYVAVTARRYKDKSKWVEEQRKQGPWADVRLLDADDLAQWLGECPAVAAWFAQDHLLDHQPADELLTSEDFLSRWSRATTPPLPHSLVLAGRSREVQQIMQWLAQDEPDPQAATASLRPLVVQAATKLEARVFVAAALAGLDDVQREDWAARTLVVESRQAWDWAVAQRHERPLLLVPAFDEFELDMGTGAHFVVVPQDREAKLALGTSALTLDDPLPWRVVAEDLERLGLTGARAQEIARESGGQLHALRRLLGLIEPPAWAKGEDHAELVAMLLVGSWRPANEADRKVISDLGAVPDAVDRMCTRLMSIDGAPIRRHGDAYRWASPAAAWHELASMLSERALQTFVKVAGEVLGEDDPRFDRAPNERFYAPVFGHTPSRSPALRQGLAESLLYLSRADDELRRRLGTSLGSRTADQVVHAVLGPHWKRWASLSNSLDILAEAAPQRFFDRLQHSLATEGGAGALFEQEGDPLLSGATPHVGLVRALELLAWDEATMSQAADALARLAECDLPQERGQPRRIGPRPLDSLEAVFHLVTPQTLAGEEERFAVLFALLERHGAVEFDLLCRLLRELQGSTLLPTSHKPRLGELDVPTTIKMPKVEAIHARGSRVFHRLIDVAGHSASRWAALIEQRIDLVVDDELTSRMIDRLVSLRDHIDDEGAVKIAQVARRQLSFFYRLSDEQSTVYKAQLHRILNIFIPTSFVMQIAWLFEPDAPLTEWYSGDMQEVADKLDLLRDPTIETLLRADGDGHEQLLDLIRRLDGKLGPLARALMRSTQRDEFDALLLHELPPPPLAALAVPFAAHRALLESLTSDWLRDLITDWRGQARTQDVMDLFLSFHPQPALWDLLDDIGEPFLSNYWSRVPQILGLENEDYERAIAHLCAAGNIMPALDAARYKPAQLRTSTLLNVLDGLHAAIQGEATPTRPVGLEVDQIFEDLDRRHDREAFAESIQYRVAQLELHFIGAFSGRRRRQPRFISRQIERNPAFFVELIETQFRSEDESTSEEVSPERRGAAALAYQVFHAWRSYPGSDLNEIDAREHVLYEWASTALELCAQKRRSNIGQEKVGEVLARATGADGHWPCEAARRLLQSGRYPQLARGLWIGIRNRRGTVVRGSYEGGTQERALAERFTQSARALRSRWPNTAQLLQDLATDYLQEAEEEDEEARSARHEDGEPPDVEPNAIAASAANGSVDKPAAYVAPDDHERLRPITRLEQLDIEDVGPANSLSIEFAPRLTLLTGDNSLGKTFILDLAWWALTGTWPDPDPDPKPEFNGRPKSNERMARPTSSQLTRRPLIRMRDEHGHVASSGFDSANEQWPRRLGWPAATCPVIYARLDDGFSVWDQLRNGLSGTGGPEPEIPAYHFSEQQVWRGLFTEQDIPLCSGLINDWRDWSRAEDPTAFEALLSVIDRLSEPESTIEPGRSTVKLGKHDDRRIPTLKFPYGDVPLVHLSAGWKRIIALAYLLVWSWNEHCDEAERQGLSPAPSIVLLIDEAEAHLHPRWQRVILPALLAAGKALGEAVSVQIIVTTHSPMVTASLETAYDADLDQTYTLELVDGRVVLRALPWAKYGDASSWLESPYFGLDMARTREAVAALNAAYAFVDGEREQLPEGLDSEAAIEAALRRSLPESHPFWWRWQAYIGDDDDGDNAVNSDDLDDDEAER